jgi:serine phosphatase RsbU (regulator of sigma subunit)/DNA-binding response OmpR family regulator
LANVLVVDDDPTNREFLRALLVHRGHQVCEAGDGSSALQMARSEAFDAVITDILMPGLDGWELARLLRSQPATSAIPIAVSTAHYTEREMRALVRACGVQDVIAKPAHPAIVLAAIDALLGDCPPAVPVQPADTHDEFVAEHRRTLQQKLLQTTVELSRVQERLTETHRVTLSGSWDLDPDASAIVMSGQLSDVLRLPSREVEQDTLWRRIHPHDLNRVRALARRTLRTGLPATVELRIAGLDGTVHEVVLSCRVTGDRLLWGVAQDVTAARTQQLLHAVEADQRARHRERERLHRTMFPGTLPRVADVDLAAMYLPARDRTDTGGDWYDVVPDGDGGVVLAVGAVVGGCHDTVGVMGPLRAVLRAFALEDPVPSRVLQRLNRFLVAGHTHDSYATALVAHYRPADRELTVANAGHSLPLLVTTAPRGNASWPGAVIISESGPALGVFPDAEFAGRRLTMTPGAMLCVYTDGLTDPYLDAAPTQYLRLAHAVIEASRTAGVMPTAERVLGHILDQMHIGPAPDDDVCLAVLRSPDIDPNQPT